MSKRVHPAVSYDLDPRRAARIELSVKGELVTSEGEVPCVIEDISLSGARVSANINLAPGDASILKCRELDILAVVQWRTEELLGLSFAEPIADEQSTSVTEENQCVEEAQRRANNRRFLRLFWNLP